MILINSLFLIVHEAWIFTEEFSREIIENESDYLISCAVSNYLYSTPFFNTITRSEMFMDGITYPSVKHTEQGMNLALIPHLINDGSLILESARYQKMERIDEKKYLETVTKIAKTIDHSKNQIIW